MMQTRPVETLALLYLNAGHTFGVPPCNKLFINTGLKSYQPALCSLDLDVKILKLSSIHERGASVAFHEDLRNHRLKKGLILEEISEDTKINVRILQALEQGDYHILPVPYVRLFMKAYAQSIDFPVEDVLRGLENELSLTGEQTSSSQGFSESGNVLDMTGAALSNAQNLLQSEKSSQNSVLRLIIGILVLLIVIIFGKSLLKPDSSSQKTSTQQVLPGINMNQVLDSIAINKTLLTANFDTLTISVTDYLSSVRTNAGGQKDTSLYNPGASFTFVVTDSSELSLYPSDAALVSIKQDTLPGSPFSNAWLVIGADDQGAHLKTFSTL